MTLLLLQKLLQVIEAEDPPDAKTLRDCTAVLKELNTLDKSFAPVVEDEETRVRRRQDHAVTASAARGRLLLIPRASLPPSTICFDKMLPEQGGSVAKKVSEALYSCVPSGSCTGF